MAVEWTGVGPDLLLSLDRSDPQPLGRQLQIQLRDAIRSGRLDRGERLPASRVLAAELGVSRGLVVDCYAQLESEGYLRSVRGAGTQVAAGAGAPAPADAPTPHRPRLDVDFEYGLPELSSFPVRDWLWAMGVAARSATTLDLGDEPGLGADGLREVLAAYLRRVRGSAARPEGIVVCAGFRTG
ncbi:MAG: GntR family transcriptional regulator / MocR family aminotransferase [Pseudonocardiales bacterium]|nr:GntR family transcriptional regulator / MocR family aminotransferase [Pseudonocardiales bacterium]